MSYVSRTEYEDEFLERMRTALFRAFEDPALTLSTPSPIYKKDSGD